MKVSPLAGQLANQNSLVDIPRLVSTYYTATPDPAVPEQMVSFGTSGHRGSSLRNSFNEDHILAITLAICQYRIIQKIDGPLFLGFDTHALSVPAFATVMEVLAAYGVVIMINSDTEYTPTPVIAHAILKYNLGRKTGWADGIILTPSHNPPDDGGLKYNPPNGGPAGTTVTSWIEEKANEILRSKLHSVKRVSFSEALKAATTHRYAYRKSYIDDLGNIIDMNLLRDSKISIGVDPLGGAGVDYWEPIAKYFQLNLTVINKIADPTFRFVPLDWDGQIRMDPSSSYAMKSLIEKKDLYDISFACDTDHDRHGIVTKSAGLLSPNHFLSVAVFYLLQHRPLWNKKAAVGKSIVTTMLLERIATKYKRNLYDVPVGFKWFVDELLKAGICFAGEESAGATFLRLNGTTWTTDKDGFIPALLSAEITAKLGVDPGVVYKQLTDEFGESFYDRTEAKIAPEQKERLENITADKIKNKYLASEKIEEILISAPGNDEPIGGLKIITKNGWFAARPSGTEPIYKIYAESFLSKTHLGELTEEAQAIVSASFEM